MYVQLLPHGERVFSISRLLKDTLRLRPWRGVPGEPVPEGGDAGGPGPDAEVHRPADLRPEHRRLQHRGRELGHQLRLPRAGPEDPVVVRGARWSTARNRSGIMEADTTLKLDKPELRVQIDRARAADLRVDPERVGTAVRLMVGGDEEVSRFRDPGNNEEYMVQLRLREEDRADPGAIGGLYVPREDGGIVQIGSVGAGRAGEERLADRPARPAAGSPPAGVRGAGVRPGRPPRRAAGRGGGDEPARRLHDERFRPREGARADVRASSSGRSPCRSSSCT